MQPFYTLPPKIIRMEFSEGDKRYSFYMHEAAFKEFLGGSKLVVACSDAKTGSVITPALEILKTLDL